MANIIGYIVSRKTKAFIEVTFDRDLFSAIDKQIDKTRYYLTITAPEQTQKRVGVTKALGTFGLLSQIRLACEQFEEEEREEKREEKEETFSVNPEMLERVPDTDEIFRGSLGKLRKVAQDQQEYYDREIDELMGLINVAQANKDCYDNILAQLELVGKNYETALQHK